MTISDDPSFINKTKSTETKLTPNEVEVNEDGLLSCDLANKAA
jgi:hypothetical protein